MTKEMLPMNDAILHHIPSRLRPFVVGCDLDSDGIWVWGNNRFYDSSSESHTIHVDSSRELRDALLDVQILRLDDPRCK